MSEARNTRFTQYFPMLLDALRSTDPAPMRPAEAVAWIRGRMEVAEDDLTRRVQNGAQSIFENDVHWARFYLVKSGLISRAKRGVWGLTPEGRAARLTPDTTRTLYERIRDSVRPGATTNEDNLPAPEADEEDDGSGRAYWFVGAIWGAEDQLTRFLQQGIWSNGYEDQFNNLVLRIKPGDRIAIKATFVRKLGLPFDVGGKPVSVMRIKATGIVLENLNDGQTVKVAWDPSAEPIDWYFFTHRKTIWEASYQDERGRKLIEFAFQGRPQDYAWWLARPRWVAKYGPGVAFPSVTVESSEALASGEEANEPEEDASYTVDDIIDEGCFLPRDRLADILERWKTKKNLILQGPPGTGKTWLAKRLGFALSGSNDRETETSRLKVVQFHPSLAYEDFVRGWRPSAEGRLVLADGVLMQAVDFAASEPDRPFVLVIEEINRGNPAQIFGEMLTLLENTKRRPNEAIQLAYRDPNKPDERVYIPDNLFVIGTMNVADRSLAIVDLALRRRFVFIDLEPQLGRPWRDWCAQRGLSEATCVEIQARIGALNAEIAASLSLGPQFRVGHSYVTPDIDEVIKDGPAWFRGKVETEIGPLLDEYWYDSPETAQAAKRKLLAGLA